MSKPRVERQGEHIRVDVRNPHWAAVNFLAVLAYPESWVRRTRAAQAMIAWCERHLIGKSRSDARMDDQQIDGQFNLLNKRLKKRLDAAREACLLEFGILKNLGEERIDDRIRQRTRFWLIDLGLSPERATERTATTRTIAGPPETLNDIADRKPSKWKNEAWRPGVLHLAVAFREVHLDLTEKDGVREHQFSIEQLLTNAVWAPAAIKSAEEIADEWLSAAVLPESLQGVRRRPLVRLIPGDSDSFEISEPR